MVTRWQFNSCVEREQQQQPQQQRVSAPVKVWTLQAHGRLSYTQRQHTLVHARTISHQAKTRWHSEPTGSAVFLYENKTGLEEEVNDPAGPGRAAPRQGGEGDGELRTYPRQRHSQSHLMVTLTAS